MLSSNVRTHHTPNGTDKDGNGYTQATAHQQQPQHIYSVWQAYTIKH